MRGDLQKKKLGLFSLPLLILAVFITVSAVQNRQDIRNRAQVPAYIQEDIKAATEKQKREQNFLDTIVEMLKDTFNFFPPSK